MMNFHGNDDSTRTGRHVVARGLHSTLALLHTVLRLFHTKCLLGLVPMLLLHSVRSVDAFDSQLRHGLDIPIFIVKEYHFLIGNSCCIVQSFKMMCLVVKGYLNQGIVLSRTAKAIEQRH